MKPLTALFLAGCLSLGACRWRSEEVSNDFELQAQARADLFAADLERYQKDCDPAVPRSDGCQGLAITLGLVGRELATAGRTDTATAALARALALFQAMDLDAGTDSVLVVAQAQATLALASHLDKSDPRIPGFLETSRVMLQSFRELHPQDSTATRLSLSIWRVIGDLHAQTKFPELALEFHRNAADLLDSLSGRFPADSALAAGRFQAWETAYRDLEAIGALARSVEVSRKALAAARDARRRDGSDPPNSVLMEEELRALTWTTLAHASEGKWALADTERNQALELARRLHANDPSEVRWRALLADAWMRSADFDCHLDRRATGERAYLGLAAFVDSFPEDSWTARARASLYSDLVECGQDSPTRLDYARKAAQWAQVVAEGSSSEELEDALGKLSWYALVDRRYSLADSAAQVAVDLAARRGDPESVEWIELNRAHALLMMGHSPEAMDIYRRLAPRRATTDDSKTYAWFIEDDFKQLEKAGIRHEDFAKVRAILEHR